MFPTWRRQFTWGVPWKIHSVFPESFSALTPGNHETASVLCMQTLPWVSVIAMNSRHIGLTHEIMFFSLFSYTHCQWYTIWLTEGRNYTLGVIIFLWEWKERTNFISYTVSMEYRNVVYFTCSLMKGSKIQEN